MNFKKMQYFIMAILFAIIAVLFFQTHLLKKEITRLREWIKSYTEWHDREFIEYRNSLRIGDMVYKLCQEKKYDLAIAWSNLNIEQMREAGNHFGGYESRGDVFYAMGENKKSLEDYLAVLKFNCKDSSLNIKIGRAYLALSENDTAIKYICNGIELAGSRNPRGIIAPEKMKLIENIIPLDTLKRHLLKNKNRFPEANNCLETLNNSCVSVQRVSDDPKPE